MVGRLLLLAALLPAAAPATAAVRVQRGIVYGHARVGAPRAGIAPLLLDLYRPARAAKTPRPVVVLIHGGGFTKQSRNDVSIVRVALGFAAEGFVAASIDYRLLSQQPVPSSRVAPLAAAMGDAPISRAIVSAVDDTLTATEYLKAHAEQLGVDPNRLGLVGSSAGAITADHVAYVLDDHGIKGPKVSFVGDLWGGVLIPSPTSGEDAADQLGHGEAPLFAVHGDHDTTVPVKLDDELTARARAEHVRVEYHRIPGGGHGYGPTGFFTRKVVGRQTPFDRLLAFARSATRQGTARASRPSTRRRARGRGRPGPSRRAGQAGSR